MKLEDLPETLTPAVLEGGYLLYVCREGWSSSPEWALRPWDNYIRPRDVVHLLEYPARPVGWYHLTNASGSFERVFWWDEGDWRVGPGDGLCGALSEDDLTITPITINEGESR